LRFARLLIFCLILALTAQAQRFSTTVYTKENGLPGNQVNKLIQDRTGRLWIGTNSGLAIFDGQRMQRPDPGNPLFNNPVKSIFQDRNANIWLGTSRKGLLKFTGSGYQLFSRKDGLSSDIINAVCEDHSGRIWVGTSDGVNRLGKNGFDTLTTSAGLVNNNVFDLYCDSKGKVWVATLGGISVFDGNSVRNFTEADGLLNKIVYKIREDSLGAMWFGTSIGISVLQKNGSFRNYTVEDGLPVEKVEDLFFDRNGCLWVATYGGGLCKITGNDFKTVRLGSDLNSNLVKSIIEDREGNYWIGTLNGIVKYNGDRFVKYTVDDGLSKSNIPAVYADSAGGIWLGTLAGGVNYFDGKSFRSINPGGSLGLSNIWCIVPDGKGNLWFGTTNGPARYNLASGNIDYPYASLQSLIIYSYLHGNDGTDYFGTDKGVYFFRNGMEGRLTAASGLRNENVRVLYEDAEHTIWIGTLKGLFYLEEGKVRSFEDSYSLYKGPVTSIIGDPEGLILASIYDFGVVRFDPGNIARPLTVLNKSNGLSNSKILFNYLDRRNNLWLGTSDGIDKVNWQLFLQSGKLDVLHYDKSNGYLGLGSNACSEDIHGNLWLGTVDGLIKYDPLAGDLPFTMPSVSLDKIQLFFEDVDWSKFRLKTDEHTGLPLDMVLPHKSNHLNFICRGVYLTAPEEVRFRYFLEGFESGWSPPTSLGQVAYSNLPPGEYNFKVQATANGRDWSVPVTFSFVIRPIIWKTPLFYALYLIIGVSTIVLTYKLRTRSLRRSKEVLKRMVDARTRELNEKNLELAKLSLVASETDNAVLIFNEHQELEWVNTGYTKMTGYTLEEVKAMKVATLSLLTTNHEVLENLDACIHSKSSLIYESEIIHKNGLRRWASSTLTPILDEKGELKNIVVIDTDITLRRQMEEQIRTALEERGLLLREIHHRVKNNLQIIISLFNLQTSYVTDQNAYKALKEGQDRIKSMALIHERFYQTDGFSRIDFDDYIHRLADNLMKNLKVNPEQVTLNIHAEKISLDIDSAVPCGLIINEIMTNSLKHAFHDGRNGKVFLEFNQIGDQRLKLVIGDTGCGMPSGFSIETADSLGIQLIIALTEQLEGSLEFETSPDRGTLYSIIFKSSLKHNH